MYKFKPFHILFYLEQLTVVVIGKQECRGMYICIREPVVDQKYACLINFPIRHAFEHVMLYTILKLEPSTSFTTSQFMTSFWHVLYDVI